MAPSSVTPFSFTYVTYIKGDVVGQFMCLVTLAPVYIIASYATLITYRRDTTSIFNTIGQFASLLVNYILKKAINQPRPEAKSIDLDDSGMPSNHAQFIWYFVAINIMQLMQSNSALPRLYQRLYSLCLFFLAILVSYSRIYLGYHTIDQVIVGGLVGSLCGIIWHYFSRRYATLILRLPILKEVCSFFVVRDYADVVFPPLEENQLLIEAKKKQI
jgi:dolichyldiphosphatase